MEKALDGALHVFWHRGYEGATLSELTDAMGINRPSLYAAFGNKEALFRKVLDRYAEGPASYIRASLEEPTGRAVIERMLRSAVELLTDTRHPRGCLAVQGALACGDDANRIRKELAARRRDRQTELCQRLQRAKSEGDLPPDSKPADLARFVMTVIQGMAVQATGGANRKELQQIAKLAMQALPE